MQVCVMPLDLSSVFCGCSLTHAATASRSVWPPISVSRHLKKELKVSKLLYFEDVCHDAAHQPRKMWGEVNKALVHGYNGGISTIRSDKGLLSGATDIVEEFNRYFSLTGTRSRQGGHTSDWGSYTATEG